MTSKLKCPVCNVPLEPVGDLLQCPNDHCGWVGNAVLWAELIRTKKQLEIAKKALHGVRYNLPWVDNYLKQIQELDDEQ